MSGRYHCLYHVCIFNLFANAWNNYILLTCFINYKAFISTEWRFSSIEQYWTFLVIHIWHKKSVFGTMLLSSFDTDQHIMIYTCYSEYQIFLTLRCYVYYFSDYLTMLVIYLLFWKFSCHSRLRNFFVIQGLEIFFESTGTGERELKWILNCVSHCKKLKYLSVSNLILPLCVITNHSVFC